MKNKPAILRQAWSGAILLGTLCSCSGRDVTTTDGFAAGTTVNATDLPTFEQYEAAARVTEGDQTYYIVEGDVMLDHEGLTTYYDAVYSSGGMPGALGEKSTTTQLVINGTSGPTWTGPDKRVRGAWLTYCYTDGWGMPTADGSLTGDKAGTMVTLRSATGEWERQANVRFNHHSWLDGAGCSGLAAAGTVDFEVTPAISNGIANVNYSAASLPLQSTQQLRLGRRAEEAAGLAMVVHEVGHLLGLLHEQTHPNSVFGCTETYPFASPYQAAGLIGLTDYDPLSIMHYTNTTVDPVTGACTFPGGTWITGMKMSSLDGYGVRVLYGGSEIFDQISTFASL